MADDDQESPRVPVLCAECETESRVPLDELAETIARHNDRLHDGADVAEVDPAITEKLADIVAEDMGLTG